MAEIQLVTKEYVDQQNAELVKNKVNVGNFITSQVNIASEIKRLVGLGQRCGVLFAAGMSINGTAISGCVEYNSDISFTGYISVSVSDTGNNRKYFNLLSYTDATWKGSWKEIADTETMNALVNQYADINSSLKNGWKSNGNTFVCRNGNCVSLNLMLKEGTATIGTVIATLPEKFRPRTDTHLAGLWFGSNYEYESGKFIVSANGDLKVSGKTPTMKYGICLSCSYITA